MTSHPKITEGEERCSRETQRPTLCPPLWVQNTLRDAVHVAALSADSCARTGSNGSFVHNTQTGRNRQNRPWNSTQNVASNALHRRQRTMCDSQRNQRQKQNGAKDKDAVRSNMGRVPGRCSNNTQSKRGEIHEKTQSTHCQSLYAVN